MSLKKQRHNLKEKLGGALPYFPETGIRVQRKLVLQHARQNVLAQKLFLTSLKKCFMSMIDNSSPVSPIAKFIYPTL